MKRENRQSCHWVHWSQKCVLSVFCGNSPSHSQLRQCHACCSSVCRYHIISRITAGRSEVFRNCASTFNPIPNVVGLDVDGQFQRKGNNRLQASYGCYGCGYGRVITQASTVVTSRHPCTGYGQFFECQHEFESSSKIRHLNMVPSQMCLNTRYRNFVPLRRRYHLY